MAEEGWGRKAADRYRVLVESAKQRQAVLLQEETSRREHGPELWADVRQHVRTRCDRLNIELGSEVARLLATRTFELQVQLQFPTGSDRYLDAEFRLTSTSGSLKWVASGHEASEHRGGEYSVVVQEARLLFRGAGGIVETPEQVAERMLDGLMLE